MCGLFGIISEEPTQFDYRKFCVLGIDNDSRGGDSCGIFIDGQVAYGVDKHKYFIDFYKTSEILKNTKKASIALGHCRKASIGAVSVENAQPVVIYKDNKPEFVVLHNGTILNYKELAKKYIPDVDIKGMTDSQVMTRIFYDCGYDVLEEYNGGAAFVIVDYRKGSPEVLLFRGESLKNNYATVASEERPLYFCIDKGVLTFSSICDFLSPLCNDETIYVPTANKLIKFVNGKVVVLKSFDRNKCRQTEPTKVKTYDYPTYVPSTYKPSYEKYMGMITYVPDSNVYKLNSRLLHGNYFISSYGCIYSENVPHADLKEFWFFNGIPFDKKTYYGFVWKYFLKTKNTMEQFIEDNISLLRFLSRDRILIMDKTVYLVESPQYLRLFSGTLRALGSTRVRHFVNGAFSFESYEYISKSIGSIESKNINLPELKKLWIL